MIAAWKPCSSAGTVDGGIAGTATFERGFRVTRLALAAGFFAAFFGVVFFGAGFFLLGGIGRLAERRTGPAPTGPAPQYQISTAITPVRGSASGRQGSGAGGRSGP